MRLLIAASLFGAFALTSAASAAVTTFTDRNAMTVAVGTFNTTENFSGFAADTSFNDVTVAAAGFSIRSTGTSTFRNNIDVVPLVFTDNNGTAHASCFTDFGVETIRVSFPTAVRGFGGDFTSIQGTAPNTEGLKATLLNGSTVVGATYTFPENDGTQFFGFTTDFAVTSILFESVRSTVGGEGYAFDNVVTQVALPEPAALAGLAGIAITMLRRRSSRGV